MTTSLPGAAELVARADTYRQRHKDADNELAAELYRKALAIAPRDPAALAGLSLALSQRATKFNRPPSEAAEAEALARRALALAPGLARAHLALGLAVDARGRVREALAAYLEAARLDPAHGAALASAANLLAVQGHLAQALEADLRAAQLHGAQAGDESPYLEVQIATVLSRLGFSPAAEVWFERALELRPDNVFAAAASARARLSAGQAREADVIAAAALGRGVRRPELATLRGIAALTAGDREAAKGFFQQAMAIRPGYPEAEARLLRLALEESPGNADLARRGRELADGIRDSRAEGDEWPDGAIVEALLRAGLGDEARVLSALDAAIELGYRDEGGLRLDPMLSTWRERPALAERLARLRDLVAAERQRVLGAPWLPPSLLSGSAARIDSLSKRSD